MAQEAKAEKTGAVNTQTVSTDRGIFKEFASLNPKKIKNMRYFCIHYNKVTIDRLVLDSTSKN